MSRTCSLTSTLKSFVVVLVILCGLGSGISWLIGYVTAHRWIPKYQEGQLVQSVLDRKPGQVLYPVVAKGRYAVRFADSKQEIVVVQEFEIEPAQVVEKPSR